MARTIGASNKALVKRTTIEVLKKRTNTITGETNYQCLDDEVVEKLPEEMFDSWEMAYQEIHNIIDDTSSDWSHGKIPKKSTARERKKMRSVS